MAEPRKRTGDALSEALEKAHAPSWMIQQARGGYYDDYRSSLMFPIHQLVHDATTHGLTDIAERAKQGEFDGQSWEADAWAKSLEGRATFRKFSRRKKK